MHHHLKPVSFEQLSNWWAFFYLYHFFLPSGHCQYNSRSNSVKRKSDHTTLVFKCFQCFPLLFWIEKPYHNFQGPVWSGPCNPHMSLISSSAIPTSFTLLQSCLQPKKHHFLASEIFPLPKILFPLYLLGNFISFRAFLESMFSVRFPLVTTPTFSALRYL